MSDAAPPSGGGRLFVVATPIGNLGDVTLRALEVLRTVPLVAAEDTRRTRRLFARHDISTRLISYHARSAPARQAALLAALRAGGDLALVTDAGLEILMELDALKSLHVAGTAVTAAAADKWKAAKSGRNYER